MNMLDFGMSVQQAGDRPRLWHRDSFTSTGEIRDNAPNIALERGIPGHVRQALAAMGHPISDEVRRCGEYQCIGRAAISTPLD